MSTWIERIKNYDNVVKEKDKYKDAHNNLRNVLEKAFITAENIKKANLTHKDRFKKMYYLLSAFKK